MQTYKTIYKTQIAEIIEKKSKFIATAVPVETRDEAEVELAKLRKQYSDATHNVFAYRIKEEVGIWERQSDDGEPSGTAGMPILDMLRGEEIVNILMVVTRYYGGTLLGTGGLVRAYGHSAKDAIVDVIEKALYACVSIKVDYTLSGKVQYELGLGAYNIKDTIYTDIVEYQVYIKEENLEEFIKAIKEMTNDNAEIELIEKAYGFLYQNEFIIG